MRVFRLQVPSPWDPLRTEWTEPIPWMGAGDGFGGELTGKQDPLCIPHMELNKAKAPGQVSSSTAITCSAQ